MDVSQLRPRNIIATDATMTASILFAVRRFPACPPRTGATQRPRVRSASSPAAVRALLCRTHAQMNGIRSVMPGVPPVGILIDYVGFVWLIMFLMVACMSGVAQNRSPVRLLLRPPPWS